MPSAWHTRSEVGAFSVKMGVTLKSGKPGLVQMSSPKMWEGMSSASTVSSFTEKFPNCWLSRPQTLQKPEDSTKSGVLFPAWLIGYKRLLRHTTSDWITCPAKSSCEQVAMGGFLCLHSRSVDSLSLARMQRLLFCFWVQMLVWLLPSPNLSAAKGLGENQAWPHLDSGGQDSQNDKTEGNMPLLQT